MNKIEVIEAVSEKTGYSKFISEKVVEAVFEVISDALVSGNKVQFVGFGSFESKLRAPRTGRNPGTNEAVHIPCRRVPVFSPGKPLRVAVNNHKE